MGILVKVKYVIVWEVKRSKFSDDKAKDRLIQREKPGFQKINGLQSVSMFLLSRQSDRSRSKVLALGIPSPKWQKKASNK